MIARTLLNEEYLSQRKEFIEQYAIPLLSEEIHYVWSGWACMTRITDEPRYRDKIMELIPYWIDTRYCSGLRHNFFERLKQKKTQGCAHTRFEKILVKWLRWKRSADHPLAGWHKYKDHRKQFIENNLSKYLSKEICYYIPNTGLKTEIISNDVEKHQLAIQLVPDWIDQKYRCMQNLFPGRFFQWLGERKTQWSRYTRFEKMLVQWLRNIHTDKIG